MSSRYRLHATAPCARCDKQIATGYARSLFSPLICKKCLTPEELAEVKRAEEIKKRRGKK